MNFSWLDDPSVAGCRGPRSDADLAFLSSVGVRALVRLAGEEETGLTSADVQRHGISDCYEPVRDRTAPSQEQLDRIIDFIGATLASGQPVAVSCGAGCGRTGTVLGCYLVSKGLEVDAAIKRLIAARPCSREVLDVPGQRDAVVQFHERRQGSRREHAV